MDESSLSQLAAWITEAGLAGHPEPAMLTGFCERLVAAGVPLAGGLVIIDTLHPIHEGHATRWRRDNAGDDADRLRAHERRRGRGELAAQHVLPADRDRRIDAPQADRPQRRWQNSLPSPAGATRG